MSEEDKIYIPLDVGEEGTINLPLDVDTTQTQQTQEPAPAQTAQGEVSTTPASPNINTPQQPQPTQPTQQQAPQQPDVWTQARGLALSFVKPDPYYDFVAAAAAEPEDPGLVAPVSDLPLSYRGPGGVKAFGGPEVARADITTTAPSRQEQIAKATEAITEKPEKKTKSVKPKPYAPEKSAAQIAQERVSQATLQEALTATESKFVPSVAEKALGLSAGFSLRDVYLAQKPEGMDEETFERYKRQAAKARLKRGQQFLTNIQKKIDPTAELPPLPKAFERPAWEWPYASGTPDIQDAEDLIEVIDFFRSGNALKWIKTLPDRFAIGAAEFAMGMAQAGGAMLAGALRSTALALESAANAQKWDTTLAQQYLADKGKEALLKHGIDVSQTDKPVGLYQAVVNLTSKDPSTAKYFYPQAYSEETRTRMVLQQAQLDLMKQQGYISEDEYKMQSALVPAMAETPSGGKALWDFAAGMVMLPVEFIKEPVGFIFRRPFDAFLLFEMVKAAPRGVEAVRKGIKALSDLKARFKARFKGGEGAVEALKAIPDEELSPGQRAAKEVAITAEEKGADAARRRAEELAKDPEVQADIKATQDFLNEELSQPGSDGQPIIHKANQVAQAVETARRTYETVLDFTRPPVNDVRVILKENPNWTVAEVSVPLSEIKYNEPAFQPKGGLNMEIVNKIAKEFTAEKFEAPHAFIDENGVVHVYKGAHRVAALEKIARENPERYPFVRYTETGGIEMYVPVDIRRISRERASELARSETYEHYYPSPEQEALFEGTATAITKIEKDMSVALKRKPTFEEITTEYADRSGGLTASKRAQARHTVGLYYLKEAIGKEAMLEHVPYNQNYAFWAKFGELIYEGRFEKVGIEPRKLLDYMRDEMKVEGVSRLDRMTAASLESTVKNIERLQKEPEFQIAIQELKRKDQEATQGTLFGDLAIDEARSYDLFGTIHRISEEIRLEKENINALRARLNDIKRGKIKIESKAEVKRLEEELSRREQELAIKETKLTQIAVDGVNMKLDKAQEVARSLQEDMFGEVEKPKPTEATEKTTKKAKEPKPKTETEKGRSEEPALYEEVGKPFDDVKKKWDTRYEGEQDFIPPEQAKPGDVVAMRFKETGNVVKGVIDHFTENEAVVIWIDQAKRVSKERIPLNELQDTVYVLKRPTPELKAKIKKMTGYDLDADPYKAVDELNRQANTKLLLGAGAISLISLESTMTEEQKKKLLAGDVAVWMEIVAPGGKKEGIAKLVLSAALIPLGVVMIRKSLLGRRPGVVGASVNGALRYVNPVQTSFLKLLDESSRWTRDWNTDIYTGKGKDVPGLFEAHRDNPLYREVMRAIDDKYNKQLAGLDRTSPNYGATKTAIEQERAQAKAKVKERFEALKSQAEQYQESLININERIYTANIAQHTAAAEAWLEIANFAREYVPELGEYAYLRQIDHAILKNTEQVRLAETKLANIREELRRANRIGASAREIKRLQEREKQAKQELDGLRMELGQLRSVNEANRKILAERFDLEPAELPSEGLSEWFKLNKGIDATTAARITGFFRDKWEKLKSVGIDIGEIADYMPMLKKRELYTKGEILKKYDIKPQEAGVEAIAERPGASYEIHRQWDLTLDMIETDMRYIADRYIRQYSKQIAWAPVFEEMKKSAKTFDTIAKELDSILKEHGVDEVPGIGQVMWDSKAYTEFVRMAQDIVAGHPRWRRLSEMTDMAVDNVYEAFYKVLSKRKIGRKLAKKIKRRQGDMSKDFLLAMQGLSVSSVLGTVSTMIYNLVGAGTLAQLRSNSALDFWTRYPKTVLDIIRKKERYPGAETLTIIRKTKKGGPRGIREVGMNPITGKDVYIDPVRISTDLLYQQEAIARNPMIPQAKYFEALTNEVMMSGGLEFYDYGMSALKKAGAGLIKMGTELYQGTENVIRGTLHMARSIEVREYFKKKWAKGEKPTWEEFSKDLNLNLYDRGANLWFKKYFDLIVNDRPAMRDMHLSQLSNIMAAEFVRQSQHVHGTLQNIPFLKQLGRIERTFTTFWSFPMAYMRLISETLLRGNLREYYKYLATTYLFTKGLEKSIGLDLSDQYFTMELFLPWTYNMQNSGVLPNFGPFRLGGTIWSPASDFAYLMFTKATNDEQAFREKSWWARYIGFPTVEMFGGEALAWNWLPTQIPVQYLPMGRAASMALRYGQRWQRQNELVQQGIIPQEFAVPPGQYILKMLGFAGHSITGLPEGHPLEGAFGKYPWLGYTSAQRRIYPGVSQTTQEAAKGISKGKYGLYGKLLMRAMPYIKPPGMTEAEFISRAVDGDYNMSALMAIIAQNETSPSAVASLLSVRLEMDFMTLHGRAPNPTERKLISQLARESVGLENWSQIRQEMIEANPPTTEEQSFFRRGEAFETTREMQKAKKKKAKKPKKRFGVGGIQGIKGIGGI